MATATQVHIQALKTDPDTTVWVEDLDGKFRIHTTHASPDCPGIDAGADVVKTTWALADGDLFCGEGCIDTDPANAISDDIKALNALSNLTVGDNDIADGIKLDKNATRPRKNDASERQMAFIGRLMIQKGLTDFDPLGLIYNSDNTRGRRKGMPSKSEAGEIIDFLMTQADVEVEDYEVPADRAWTVAQAVAWLDETYGARKLDHGDIHELEDDDAIDGLIAACRTFLDGYAGDFSYLTNIKERGFDDGRDLKGVVNCIRAAARRGELDGPKADAKPGKPTAEPVNTDDLEGLYLLDDVIWKVQFNRAKTNNYAKKLVVRELSEAEKAEHDDDRTHDGEFVYVGKKPLRSIATEGVKLSIEEAAKFGQLYGVCGACAANLTDETSIERGLGPWCARKYF